MDEVGYQQKDELIEASAGIVAAFVSHNALSAADLPKLISDVFAALQALGTVSATGRAEPQKPAVPIRKSVTPDFLICLEDGMKFKSLKRHIRTKYEMTPRQYREKWNLPPDYPMVAPNYSRVRSSLARTSGLGKKPAGSSAGSARNLQT